ncbi:probable G-protein coupled receptor 139 [Hemiscyllium ocellatum]|uniref:probable G-protein coupled receptor 139 n=1 Tax=Hemiscyllium ocellatum TaxID=170820 RepID=UPI0029665EA6|nr:probable G-protein coupled receptor 139 [Hemiscyllium ocellatum]
MAATDLLVIVTIVILNRIAGIYFPSSFLSITPVCSVRSILNFAAIDSSAWLTVAFTFDRFVAISCQKLKIKYCTKKVAARVIGILSVLAFMKNVFLYFQMEPKYIVDNVPWLCSLKTEIYMIPGWIAYDFISSSLTTFLPSVLILLLNALTVRYILMTNKARNRLRAQKNKENQSDPEMEKRRHSIILLFTISGSFILLYLPSLITSIYVRIVKVTYSLGPIYILRQTGYMLQLMSSCVNPFIYAGTQSKFRARLADLFAQPLKIFTFWK